MTVRPAPTPAAKALRRATLSACGLGFTQEEPMTNRRKPARRYKDSGPVRFTVTQDFTFPRRQIKKLFDFERKALLSELKENGAERLRVNHARTLKFEDFLVELDSNFADAVLNNEFDPNLVDEALDWMAGQFDMWVDR